jgi:hypothetical protein
MKIVVGDDEYEFRPQDMTPKIARRVRLDTGMSAAAAHREMGQDPDIDVVAVLCYAAALQSGANPNWDKFSEGLSWLDVPEVEWVPDGGDGSDPET